MPTDEWERSHEDQVPPFGKHTFTFKLEAGSYEAVIDPSNPHKMAIRWASREAVWLIERIDKNGSQYRISGMAEPAAPILDDHAWFELWMSETPKIIYWGNQVVLRTDHCLNVSQS